VIGGALISIATSLMYLMWGKFVCLSEYLRTSLQHCCEESKGCSWKFSFLVGMIIHPACLVTFKGNTMNYFGYEVIVFDSIQQQLESLNYFGYILSGFLVGYGLSLAKGGFIYYGACGVPSFSLKSLIAILIAHLSATGFATLRSYG